MRSEIKKSKLPVGNDYPKLMVNTCDPQFVILFRQDGEGVVVHPDSEGHHYLGEYCQFWTKAEYFWQDFEGQVILSND